MENLLSSEAICGDQITLKPFLAVSQAYAKIAGGLADADAPVFVPANMCHNLFCSTFLVLLSLGSITWHISLHNYPYRKPKEDYRLL